MDKTPTYLDDILTFGQVGELEKGVVASKDAVEKETHKVSEETLVPPYCIAN